MPRALHDRHDAPGKIQLQLPGRIENTRSGDYIQRDCNAICQKAVRNMHRLNFKVLAAIKTGARERVRELGCDAFRAPRGQMRGGATQAMLAHRRGAPTKQMPTRRRNPLGARGVAGQYLRCSSSTMCPRNACIARHQPPPRALILARQSPCARHILILGHAP
jgi:hypothetical protein